MITRRTLMASAAALALQPSMSFASIPDLRAAPADVRLGPPDLPTTAVWAYGDVPGPTIRVPRDGRVQRRFVNDLPQASSVHWHGIRIDNAMDGVAGLTQQAVPAGGTFDYDFAVPDAGTYWYHPHNRTWEQLARGLYGALIVEEDTPPDVDRDEVLLIDDWRLTQDGELHDSFGSLMDWSHAGRIGNWVTVNGKGEHTFEVQQGERLRLRLVNTANARIFDLALGGLKAWLVALDGQPMEAVEEVEALTLGPAQRADVIVDVTAEDEAFVISRERDGDFAISTLRVSGTQSARDTDPVPLPPNDLPQIDLAKARTSELVMEGGAMGGMRGAMMGGRQMGARELAGEGMTWALNGIAGMPEEPMMDLALGETVSMRLVNDTGWPHAIHLHGMHFREARDGTLGPWRDTLLIDPQAETAIAFVADNPGDWLLHCHMVEHAASGMMTWIKVSR